MDPITHTLTGIQLGRLGPAHRMRERVILVTLASLMPDVDFIVAMLLDTPLSFMVRRMYTHSILGLLISSIVAALILGRIVKHRTFANLLAWMLLGSSIHVAMDILNSYGVVLFHPMSYKRIEVGCAFIVDPWMWAILAAPLLLGFLPFGWADVSKLAKGSLAVLCIYIIGCMGARHASISILENQLKREGVTADMLHVFPEPFGPHRFRGAILTGDTYRLYLIDLMGSSATFTREEHTAKGLAAVSLIRKTAAAQQLDWFFAAPVWKKVEGVEDIYEVSDLRFRSLLLDLKRHPFTYRFRVEGEEVEGPWKPTY